ncbi:hypothetical protein HU200_048639 [Digitaria exilis]|uniref:Uncharacterized protein n=1 Tax=Digitaria exilis TaxID=1010633 RepID=A0A835ASF7_9POAL|nr:hypothetical protein HU200_048639 [Digitaria exilis]
MTFVEDEFHSLLEDPGVANTVVIPGASGDTLVKSMKHPLSFGYGTATVADPDLRGGHTLSDTKYPGVICVKPNTFHKLHTTRSWDFLGLNYYQPSGLLNKANYGKDIIVGVVDSDIWPESISFDDSGYGPVPKRWKGKCQPDEEFDATSCNRKIIGARWYLKHADAKTLVKGERMSPRDTDGHGTHTAATVAGVPVRNASHGGGGLGAGVARGGAPRSLLAVYKACRNHRVDGSVCSEDGVLAAMDDAVNDGVDVLSLSLGGMGEFAGTLHVVASGVTVVFAGGNSGPVPETVENASPWAITVAASTIDRSFPTEILLGNGEKMVVRTAHDIIIIICDEENLESVNVTGKIVVCFAPFYAADDPPDAAMGDAFRALSKAQAKGMIFAEYIGANLMDSAQTCEGTMVCVLIDYHLTYRIVAHIKSARLAGRSPVVKISPAKTVFGDWVLSPRVASFSARGPSMAYPGILKPDIAAPGVSILAATGDSYELMSGTSMACPHVSAVVALIKSVHPKWSPAMIKSAIVTTASVTDRFGMPIQADGAPRKIADPFDFGGGHINPERAVDPGLNYDINPQDYTKFFNCTLEPDQDCTNDIGNLYFLNLPSIAVPDLMDSVTVWRTVTNVGPAETTYQAMVEAPTGVTMSVDPLVITFKSGGSQTATFKVMFKARQRVQGGYTFGSLTWLDGRTHSVRIPVAVRTIIHDSIADAS